MMQARVFDGYRKIGSQHFELHDFGGLVGCAVFRALRATKAQAAQVRPAPGNQRDEHFALRCVARGCALFGRADEEGIVSQLGTLLAELLDFLDGPRFAAFFETRFFRWRESGAATEAKGTIVAREEQRGA